ncbi:hypothetical protein DFP72DRAFT_771740, partial [Ephemerocybe angulata]
MRQTLEGGPDARYRRALENMRYGACDEEDFAFLRTLIARRGSETKCLSLPIFRNVSIITSRNSYKDRYNELGCESFAKGRGETLHTFHSVDFMANNKDETADKKRLGKRKATKVGLPESLQRLLWTQEPHTSDHIPAVLKLCKGMPVMLRNNDATELCITKGQEGLVVGWDSRPGKYNTQTLETVYVKLLDPPKSVSLPGLDKNVVPITKSKTEISCDMPDGKPKGGLAIERQQVNILPNFSMTDYASQGKSRTVNIVDLSMAPDVQNVYTALSRSRSAEGTVIVQSFSMRKLIGSGIDGYQRQEFRELAWLDKITEMQYEETLPEGVKGDMRYPLIKSFRALAGTQPAITEDPNLLEGIVEPKRNKNRVIHNEEFSKSNILWNSKALSYPQAPKDKRKRQGKKGKGAEEINRLTDYNDSTGHTTKKARGESGEGDPDSPDGFIWDSKSYSCAYDALFTVLYNIWTPAPDVWGPRLRGLTPMMKELVQNFTQISDGTLTMEEGRDNMRELLFRTMPEEFPKGRQFASIDVLVRTMLESDEIFGATKEVCIACSYTSPEDGSNGVVLYTVTTLRPNTNRTKRPGSLAKTGIEDALYSQATSTPDVCPNCANRLGTFSFMWRQMDIAVFPDLLALELADNDVQRLEPMLRLPSTHGHCLLSLRGVIYHSTLGGHFTSRVVDPSGGVWYHDGAVTGRDLVYESLLVGGDQDNEWLNTGPQDYKRVWAIYGRL